MNCADYMNRIGDYCDKKLSPARRRDLEEHVAACPACKKFHDAAMEITCREVVELYEYVENSLPPERRAIFERHFSICPECRDYFESYKQTMRMEKLAYPEPPKAGAIPESLVRSILGKRKQA